MSCTLSLFQGRGVMLVTVVFYKNLSLLYLLPHQWQVFISSCDTSQEKEKKQPLGPKHLNPQ